MVNNRINEKKAILINARGGSQWMGGLYYAKNIAFVLSQNVYITNCYRILINVRKQYLSEFSDMPDGVEIISKVYSEATDPSRNEQEIYLEYNVKFVYQCINKIDSNKFVCVEWIPDFQHNHYPFFFPKEEIESRNRRFAEIANNERPLILSSNDCRRDFSSFYSHKVKKTYVVPFVSYIEEYCKKMNEDDIILILRKYELESEEYIYVGNQFWQHKNHMVVFRMINKLEKEKRLQDIHLVFTGELSDYRNDRYIDEIVNYIEENKLQHRISILGRIDRYEQIVLMRKAKLIVQPSLFEGWGTVVEDCKVLDKTIVASDISLHREQLMRYEKSYFFNPYDEEDLMKKIDCALDMLQPDNLEKGIKRMYDDAKQYSKEFEKMIVDFQ